MPDAARRVLPALGVTLALAMTLMVAADSPPAQGAGLPAAGATSNRQAWPAQAAAARPGTPAVSVTQMPGSSAQTAIAPLHGLLQADLLVVDAGPLSPSVAAALRRLPGVTAVQQIDAARLQLDGKTTAMLGVDPSVFRAFAAQPTAGATGLWQNVAAGGVAVSYTMGTMDKLPMGRPVQVEGSRIEELPLAGLGTVGIPGVDAVVSDSVARSLGIPAGNAIVVSAPHASLTSLLAEASKLLPPGAQAAPLVAQATTVSTGSGSGSAGSGSAGSGSAGSSGNGPGLSTAQVVAFLKAAESRLGMPYVWGGAGPTDFDCSGLVQWSMAQAGIVMPRVAADQALTGPLVPVNQLQPGDLLFYHTDPTAPDYISHVAIYLGDGVMLQAPEPGLDVEVVPAAFGTEFAGAIEVYPAAAAAVAGDSAT
jgi:cell wall-associated NlpC family hydrolase